MDLDDVLLEKILNESGYVPGAKVKINLNRDAELKRWPWWREVRGKTMTIKRLIFDQDIPACYVYENKSIWAIDWLDLAETPKLIEDELFEI